MTNAARRARILFPFAVGPRLGGSHLSALGLIRGLDPARFEPIILLHDGTGPLVDHLHDNGIDYVTMSDTSLLGVKRPRSTGETGLMGYLLKTVPAMVRTIRRIDPDIVHTNDGRMHVNWALPTRLSGRKLLWHHRQDPGAFGANKVAPLLADHIASVSYFSKPNAPVRNIDGKFSVVRSPFSFTSEVTDKRTAHQAICDELRLPEHAVLLGYFGNLVTRKRPLHFVKAVAAVQAARPDVPVHGLLFGHVERANGNLDEKVAALAEDLGMGGQIHTMGFRQPITPYMAGVDVSLVTAVNEPFGRTLIEAMHLGTPVVATDHGGNPEAIDDGVNGFLVDHVAPEAFVAPVTALMDDRELYQRIVAAARQGIEEQYGEARHISEISSIYEGLLRS